MENKLYIHKILIGDYVEHVRGFGYVISITVSDNNKITYMVIDFNEKEVIELEGTSVSVACCGFEKVVVGCYYLKVVKRSMTFNYNYVCKNYCNHLKTFPEACEKYCPLRKISGSTYFPSLQVRNSIRFVGFFDTVGIYAKYFNGVFNYLSKSLPKPDSRFRDLSIEGVLDILNNGDKYKLQDYIVYKTDISRINCYCNIELSKYIIKDNFIPSILEGEEHPCDYCIYKDTIECNNCKLKEI